MRVKNWLIGLAGAFMIGGMATAVQAAPAGGLTGNLKSTAEQMSNVDQARYRCWWHRGHRHCRRVYGYYPYYAPYYGPSFGFYFGGFGHRHWRHHRHHHW